MSLTKTKSFILVSALAVSLAALAQQPMRNDAFQDQAHYELFYEYVYQLNYTEFLLANCVGDRGTAAKYYLGVTLSFPYQQILMETGHFVDLFSSKSLPKRLWEELARGVRRAAYEADPQEPVAFAQHNGHKLFDEFEGDQAFLCDYVWWEEFELLRGLSTELIKDARRRYRYSDNLRLFLAEVSSAQRNMDTLWELAPWTPGRP